MGPGCRRAWWVARRRWRGAAWLAAAWLAACALAAARLAASRLAAPHVAVHDFPDARPDDLAHLLADISAHTLQGSWSLEEEAGNYTSWRYSVSYSCGERCAGRARVEAHEVDAGAGDEPRHGEPRHGETRHGAAHAHRVLVRRTHCTAPPLLPWPQLCEEIETESLVSRLGSGARLQERWQVRCALLGACPAARRLPQLARERRARLAARLPAPAPAPAT